MRIVILVASLTLLLVATLAQAQNVPTTADVLTNIYYKCIDSKSMLSCVKPKVLSYLSDAAKQERLSITEDLSIIKSRESSEEDNHDEYYPTKYDIADPTRRELLRSLMLEKVDAYLSSHTLEAKLPEAIIGSDIVPRSLIENVPKSLSIPLTGSPEQQGRGFVKKVMIPFLLGLKFKAAVLVPLALILIALKSWQALTLGLVSLVLSGAMMIFKLTKPKVAYEVVHYGHPPVEHPPHWDTSAHGPYRAYRK